MHPALAESLGRVQVLRIVGDVLPGGRLSRADPESEVRGWMPRGERVLEQELSSGAAELR